jgi:hypothetical protein
MAPPARLTTWKVSSARGNSVPPSGSVGNTVVDVVQAE